MINQIDSWSVDQITSGQVVTSLLSAIKELIENSLDAGASVIDIKLQNHGRDGITVLDNGHGIEPEDFPFIAQKHATSKISSFSDLDKVKTLGFRGEALASLCALADVTITTNTGKESRGYQLTFDHKGQVASSEKIPAPKGTIVSVTNIFDQLPVRRKSFEKNSSREFAKAVALVQEYALLSPARITLEHILKNRSTITLRSQGAKLMQRIACVYGAMRTKSLQYIEYKNPKLGWEVTGYISKPVFGLGSSGSTCQLLAVNGRPTQQPRIQRAIVEVYKQFNLTEQPFFVFDMTISPELYDVNVSPDKRSLLFHHEDEIVLNFRTFIENAFDESDHSVPRAPQGIVPPPVKRAKQTLVSFASYAGTGSMISQVRRASHAESNTEGHQKKDSPERTLEDEISESSESGDESEDNIREDTFQKSKNGPSTLKSQQPPRLESYATNTTNDTVMASENENIDDNESSDEQEPTVLSSDSLSNDDESTESMELSNEPGSKGCISNSSYPSEDVLHPVNETNDQHNTLLSSLDASPLSSSSSDEYGPSSKNRSQLKVKSEFAESCCDSKPKKPSSTSAQSKGQENLNGDTVSRLRVLNSNMELDLDISDVESAVKDASLANEKSMKRVQTLAIDEEGVEERLRLSIHKQDFEKMEVVGQFNLGFILVVNRKANHDDLFVVDQHASDEIYNFERLQTSTSLSRQPLVVPHVLELSAVEELTMQEHLEVFENNGFKISFKPENPPGRQCILESVPFSKSTVFDERDVFELLSKLKEEPNQPWLRCSKLRAMFAMRACRSSIMIGRPLSKSTMETVVKHMGTLNKPWNCPHGRPTLRHITSLS